MGSYTIKAQNGKTYTVKAPSPEAALEGFKKNYPTLVKQGRQEEYEALPENLKEYAGPQVPAADLPHDGSGYRLDQPLEEQALRNVRGAVAGGQGDTLRRLELLDEHNQQLPRPDRAMYTGQEGTDQQIHGIYDRRKDVGEEERALSTDDTYRGTSIPSPSPAWTPLGRAMDNFGAAAIDAASDAGREILSFGAAGLDAMGFTEGLSEKIDEESPSYKDSTASGTVGEMVGRELPAYLVARKVGGRGMRGRGVAHPKTAAATEAIVSGISSDSDNGGPMFLDDLMRGAVDYLPRQMQEDINALDDHATNKLVEKVGTILELYTVMRAGDAIGNAVSVGSNVIGSGVVEPMKRFAGTDGPVEYMARDVVSDVMQPAAHLTPEQHDRVFAELKDSLAEVGKTLSKAKETDDVATPSLTAISEGLLRAAKEEGNEDVAEVLEEMSRIAMRSDASSSIANLPQLASARDQRLLSGTTMADDVIENVEGASGNITEQATDAANLAVRDERAFNEGLSDRFTKAGQSMMDAEDSVWAKVQEKYANVKELTKDLEVDPELADMVNRVGGKLPENPSYGDLLDQMRPLNTAWKRARTRGDSELAGTIDQIRQEIIKEGELYGPEVKTALDDARDFYKGTYADDFNNTENVRSAGLPAVSEMRSSGEVSTGGKGSLDRALRKEMDEMFSEDGQRMPRERAREVVERELGPEGTKDFDSAAEVPELRRELKSKTDTSLKSLDPFLNTGAYRPLGGDVKGSGDTLVTQFDNLLKGGTDGPTNALSELKRLSPEDYSAARQNLKKGALDWIKKKLTTKGRITEKTEQDLIDQAFALMDTLEPTAGERQVFNALKQRFSDVAGYEVRKAGGVSMEPSIATAMGKSAEQGASGVLDKGINLAFGILNPTATRIKQLKNTAIKSTSATRQQFFQRVGDELLANPDKLLEEINKFTAKDDNPRKALARGMREFMRPLFASIYNGEEDEAFDKALDQEVNEILKFDDTGKAVFEMEELQRRSVGARADKLRKELPEELTGE